MVLVKSSFKVMMRKVSCMVQLIRFLDLDQDAVLGVDFYQKTKAVFNVVEGTSSTQQCREANTLVSRQNENEDVMRSALLGLRLLALPNHMSFPTISERY